MEWHNLTSQLTRVSAFSVQPLWDHPVRSAVFAMAAFAALWMMVRGVAWLRCTTLPARGAAGAERLPGGAALQRKAIRLARKGDPREAGHLFEILGDLEQAAEQYERARAFPEVAAVLERARQWPRAAAFHERAGNLVRAAECHLHGREYRRAADLFLKAGRDLRAAEALEQGREYAEAAALCERAGHLERVAALHERSGAFAAAADALERHLRIKFERGADRPVASALPADAVTALQKAANLYRMAQQPAKAACLLLYWGAEGEAAQAFLEAGEPRRALDLYRGMGKLDEALAVTQLLGAEAEGYAIRAEQLLRGGALREAAEAWERAGELDRAADLHRELHDWSRAGELFARAGDRDSAAEMFEVAGDWGGAATAYTAARRFGDAGRCYRRAGMAAEAARSMIDGGDVCGGAALLAESGLADEAISLLQKIPQESPDYGRAGLSLGGLLLARGLAEPARVRLEASLGRPETLGDTAELHYLLGRANEALERPAAALEHYEHVLANKVDYQDAGARAADLRERISRQTEGAEATVALGGGPPGIPALYRVTRELGRGGMGIVYEASHQVLRRRVALKVPVPEIQSCPAARERFLSEARIAAGLRHPNIVTIYDAGEANGGLYIAMALIDGITLEEHLARRGPLPPGELMPLARQICAGLAHAHAHNIVHADVKPANMLLDSAGTIHLTDFGLARAWDGTDAVTLEARGTPSYIAPEQVRGEALDPRTDIYSLGCTFYRLLVGAPPFAKGNILYAHLYEEPPRLRDRSPEIPEALDATILRCLAKRPADRFPSMTHLLDALEEALASAPTVPVPAAEVDTVTALTP